MRFLGIIVMTIAFAFVLNSGIEHQSEIEQWLERPLQLATEILEAAPALESTDSSEPEVALPVSPPGSWAQTVSSSGSAGTEDLLVDESRRFEDSVVSVEEPMSPVESAKLSTRPVAEIAAHQDRENPSLVPFTSAQRSDVLRRLGRISRLASGATATRSELAE